MGWAFITRPFWTGYKGPSHKNNKNCKLFNSHSLREQPCQGTYTINVPSDQRIGRTAREALLNVRRTTVQIQRPDQLNTQNYPASITINARRRVGKVSCRRDFNRPLLCPDAISIARYCAATPILLQY